MEVLKKGAGQTKVPWATFCQQSPLGQTRHRRGINIRSSRTEETQNCQKESLTDRQSGNTERKGRREWRNLRNRRNECQKMGCSRQLKRRDGKTASVGKARVRVETWPGGAKSYVTTWAVDWGCFKQKKTKRADIYNKEGISTGWAVMVPTSVWILKFFVLVG